MIIKPTPKSLTGTPAHQPAQQAIILVQDFNRVI